MSAPLRGQIYRADIGFGAKPWLVVSNNHRNRALSDLLAVRITTTDRHTNLPTWIRLGTGDPLVGYVNTTSSGPRRRSSMYVRRTGMDQPAQRKVIMGRS